MNKKQFQDHYGFNDEWMAFLECVIKSGCKIIKIGDRHDRTQNKEREDGTTVSHIRQ